MQVFIYGYCFRSHADYPDHIVVYVTILLWIGNILIAVLYK